MITLQDGSLFAHNGVAIGSIICGDDGFYAWWPPHPSTGGCWDQGILTEIVELLATMNKAWAEQIENDPVFKRHNHE